MTIKIAFAGAPNSGKTTVAQSFAPQLRFKTKKRVELIDEHARQFVSKFGKPTVYDQYLIAHKQIDKENEASNSDYLITDSPAFLGLVYAHLSINWKNITNKETYYLNELNNILITNFHAYDYIFYSNPIKNDKIVNDGKRVHVDLKEIEKIDKMILSFVNIYSVDFISLSGDVNSRVKKSLEIVLSK